MNGAHGRAHRGQTRASVSLSSLVRCQNTAHLNAGTGTRCVRGCAQKEEGQQGEERFWIVQLLAL